MPWNPSVGPTKPQRSPSITKRQIKEDRTHPEGAPSPLVQKTESRPVPEGENRPTPPTPAKRTHIRNKTKRTPRQTSYDSSLNPFGDEEEDQILKDDKACEK